MADIALTYTFATGNTGLGVKIMQNFNDLLAVLNANLDQDNIDDETWLSIQKMIASTKFVAALIENQNEAADLVFDISDVAAVKFKITDSADAVLFQIEQSGTVKVGA